MRKLWVLAWFAMLVGCDLPWNGAKYFAGEIELEINGEAIRHSRVWKCVEKIVFRPVDKDLFEQVYRQRPPPKEGFVVKRFGTDQAVLFDNWSGCGEPNRRAGAWTEVSVFDSTTSPTYAERLYLKAGAPVTVQDPFENRFKVRLIKHSVTESDARSYEAGRTKLIDDGPELLYQLRLKAAYGLSVDMFVWNEVDKVGRRSGVAFNKGVWEVVGLQAPPRRPPNQVEEQHEPHNAALVLLPLGYRGADGKLSAPGVIHVALAGRAIELDSRGSAVLVQPEPGIKMVRLDATVRNTIWTLHCLRPDPLPQCPKLATGIY
jgi:hypothetical protein